MAKCRFLGRSCLEIITINDHIIIDPKYFVAPNEGIDTIFLTHEHEDHANLEKIREIYNKYASLTLEIIGPKTIGKDLDLKITPIKGGNTIKLKDLTVKAFEINCYKAEECLAYLIFKGDIRLVHSADSANYSNTFKDFKNSINYLFTACVEDYFDAYYKSIKEISPQVVFPYHFNPGEEKSAKKLNKYLRDKGIKSQFIEIGTEFEF